MKKLPLFLLATISAWQVRAIEIKFPMSAIPKELLQNVNAVVREDQVVFKILSKDRASLYTQFVVTVLNEKGNNFAHQTLGYNKLTRIVEFNATVYDALGVPIKKLKNSEIYDQSAFDGFSLYSDQRIKSADLTQATYPYTVEFEYSVEYNYLYSIPGTILGGEKHSVQHASYQLIFPQELTPRYKTLNVATEPFKQSLGGGRQSIMWSFSNMEPIKFEPSGPPHEELLAQILAAPTLFEYDGYAGNMSTWEDYGKWNAMLNKDRDVLPLAAKQKVIELTKGLTNTEQKAKVLYEYLQNRTRYVSIQLGIGGLQPFPASVVDETGYGDCKALSNYMVALLKEAGIKGYYVTVNSGENAEPVIVDFPSHQSNHVIVAVPNGKDTLWMECTSQSTPFGYMGAFTGDRLALMITDAGGKLVRTPVYAAEQNRQSRTAYVLVDAAGNAKASIRTTFSGIQYENGGLDQLLGTQYDDQKKWVQNNIEIPNFTVNTFSITGYKKKLPSAVVILDLTLSRYASVSGKRLFLSPNLMNKASYIPPAAEDRKTEVMRYSNYEDLDTVLFRFPENLNPEFIPQGVKISSRFGEYETTYQVKDGEVQYVRRMKVWKGRFPKESYKELIDFYKSVIKSDNTKLVFLNKT